MAPRGPRGLLGNGHFGKHVSDDLAIVVLRHVEQLRPGEQVVHVVLHAVVLWQAMQIRILHRDEVLEL